MQRTTDGKHYPRKFQADYCMRDPTTTICMNNTIAKPPTPRVWRPKENQENNSGTVPEWEKEFTVKVGLFPSWERFTEAKKMLFPREKMLSMGQRNGFGRKKNHLPFSESMPDPNMHIDKIDWTTFNSDFHVKGSAKEKTIDWRAFSEPFQVKLEDIVPTGWDVDVVQESGDLLTGLIVSDHHAESWEPALWSFRTMV